MSAMYKPVFEITSRAGGKIYADLLTAEGFDAWNLKEAIEDMRPEGPVYQIRAVGPFESNGEQRSLIQRANKGIWAASGNRVITAGYQEWNGKPWVSSEFEASWLAFTDKI